MTPSAAHTHVIELLPDWMNAALDEREAREVSAHLDACPDCNTVFASYQEILGALALTLAPVHPDPSVRARLVQTIAGGRLHRFAGQVSALFAIDDGRARAALDQIDQAEGWEPAPLPGVWQRIVEGAPPGHMMGFIRIPTGVSVPWHEHLGEERTLVLQGRLVDDGGRIYRPGDEMPAALGSRHTFVADGPVDLVCGLFLQGGYTLLD
ncbi:MAG: cupin domain-containing protein [Pseudomonadota bacterium]|nr:cupin domain-containing protein [Pseudomonadota bacterium]